MNVETEREESCGYVRGQMGAMLLQNITDILSVYSTSTGGNEGPQRSSKRLSLDMNTMIADYISGFTIHNTPLTPDSIGLCRLPRAPV